MLSTTKITLACGALAALTFSFATPSLAKTPDGSTPATETICDQYKDDIPGLYGLCVAYCEAQDLDDFDKDSNSEQSLSNNFMRKSGGAPISCGGGRD